MVSTREIDRAESAKALHPSTARITISQLSRAAKAGIVTVPEAAKALSLARRDAAPKLATLARKGWLTRIRRGLYLILPLEAEPGRTQAVEDPWVLAHEAFSPCYIGGWSAAEHWGLTEQIFRSTLVVTSAHVRSRSVTLLGHEFRLFRVPRSRLIGVTEIWRGSERVAASSRERMIVDCLRHPELCGGVRHLVDIMRNYASHADRDFGLLAKVAREASNGAGWKRLGHLSEHLWPQQRALINEAHKRLTSGTVKLDPDVARRGKRLRRWGLWINVAVPAPSDET